MNKSLTYKLIIALCLPIAVISNVHAKEHSHSGHAHKEEKRDAPERVQHGSHEHGAARLTVAKTEQGLEMMLESPAVNLFGFEHQAHDKEEHGIVHQAKEKLEKGDALFVINEKAKCELTTVDIDSDIVSAHEKAIHNDEHKSDHHGHKEQKNHGHHAHEHKEGKNKDHAHHKEDHESHGHETETSHSDVEVNWTFTCKNITDLKSVETKLFSQFPKGFEQLSVEWITQESAGTSRFESDGVVAFSK